MIPFSVHAEKGEGKIGRKREGRNCLFDGKTGGMVFLLCTFFIFLGPGCAAGPCLSCAAVSSFFFHLQKSGTGGLPFFSCFLQSSANYNDAHDA